MTEPESRSADRPWSRVTPASLYWQQAKPVVARRPRSVRTFPCVREHADTVSMTRRFRPPLKRLTTACLCLAATMAVAGCSPIQDGKTGISRDADGHLVGLAKACEGKYDGAGIFQDDDPEALTMVQVAEWSRQDPSGTLLTWRLDEVATGLWTTSKPLTADALTAGHLYVMDAFGEDQKWSADDLRFAIEDLTTITEDTVLTGRVDPKTGESGSALIPRAEFTASACKP